MNVDACCVCCLLCWLHQKGFAELEYGILRWMGAIDGNTPVVTTIHDCQLLEEGIDPSQMLEHDVPVDIIVTPTQVIKVDISWLLLRMLACARGTLAAALEHLLLAVAWLLFDVGRNRLLQEETASAAQAPEHVVLVDIIVTPTQVLPW
jgi:hypothetical protein